MVCLCSLLPVYSRVSLVSHHGLLVTIEPKDHRRVRKRKVCIVRRKVSIIKDANSTHRSATCVNSVYCCAAGDDRKSLASYSVVMETV